MRPRVGTMHQTQDLFAGEVSGSVHGRGRGASEGAHVFAGTVCNICVSASVCTANPVAVSQAASAIRRASRLCISWHAFAFLLLLAIALANATIGELLYLAGAVSFWRAMWRVFGGRWWATALRFAAIGIVYLVVLPLALVWCLTLDATHQNDGCFVESRRIKAGFAH